MTRVPVTTMAMSNPSLTPYRPNASNGPMAAGQYQPQRHFGVGSGVASGAGSTALLSSASGAPKRREQSQNWRSPKDVSPDTDFQRNRITEQNAIAQVTNVSPVVDGSSSIGASMPRPASKSGRGAPLSTGVARNLHHNVNASSETVDDTRAGLSSASDLSLAMQAESESNYMSETMYASGNSLYTGGNGHYFQSTANTVNNRFDFLVFPPHSSKFTPYALSFFLSNYLPKNSIEIVFILIYIFLP